MTQPTPVVDVHYHYLPIVPDELVELVAYDIIYGLKKNNQPYDSETLHRLARDTLIDPTGQVVLSRNRDLNIDVTVVNTTDVMIPGIVDADFLLKANKAAADLARNNPGRILALAGVDPRRKAAPEIARTCLEDYGMIGIKWHPDYGFDPAGAEAYEVLKVLEKNNGILLTHTGYMPGGRSKFCDLNRLADILCDFPDLTVIAAHMGKSAWHEFAGLAHDFPNLYGDLAVWSRYADRNWEFFCRQLRELTFYTGAEKVLWGTDDPFENYTVPTERFLQMMRDLAIKTPAGFEFSQEEVDLMLGGNAIRVLGLDTSLAATTG